jgi:hypothetical protein
MTVVLHPPYFPLFPGLKIKLKGCHFGTTEAVLNIVTEHDFEDTLKEWQKQKN